MDVAIQLLREVSRADLKQCQAAIKSGDEPAALEAIERVFAKIDSAIDILQSQPPRDN